MTRLSEDNFKKIEEQLIEINGEMIPAGEAARWMLLLEALDVIAQAYEEKNIEFNTDIIVKKAKQHKAITKYINERYVAFLHGLFV